MENRLFEFLAATKADGSTKVPGEDSFTSALIWALESLVAKQPEGRFTTSVLANEIRKHEHFPIDQQPVLSNRENLRSCAGRIMLQPLRKEGSIPHTPPMDDLELANRHTLTLHFDFSKPLLENEIENLGNEFNDMFGRNPYLGVNRIRWGCERSIQATVQNAILAFRLAAKRRQIERHLSPINTGSANNGWLSPNCTSPLALSPNMRQVSPSPTNRHSPQVHELTFTGHFSINTPEYSPDATSPRESHKLEDYDQRHPKRKRRPSEDD